jgi:hypothetical protein
MATPTQRHNESASTLAYLPSRRSKPWIHEHHHVALGHVESIEEYRLHRGLQEVEAESATYVAMGALGFDTSAYSFDYITGWAKGDPKLLMATAERVLDTAHETIERLTPTPALDGHQLSSLADSSGISYQGLVS